MRLKSVKNVFALPILLSALLLMIGRTRAASNTQSTSTTSAGRSLHPSSSSSSGVSPSQHVVLVIEENHTFSEVYPNGMPWLVEQGNRYGFATNYHANEPGSALDYFWLSSGSGEHTFGCEGWGCPRPITSDNIFRELNAAGLSWKVYAESLPSVGWMGGDRGAYVERHNPAKWYSDVINSPSEQRKMVPFTQFAVDLALNQLPNYSLIIPNVDHDAHDGTLAQADTWLRNNVAPLLNQSYFQPGGDGLMLVTFDECDAAVGACPQQVYTAVIGPNVEPGYQSGIYYKHENTLRTVLDALGVTVYPGASRDVAAMEDFFVPSGFALTGTPAILNPDETMTVTWTAPPNSSVNDWIGLYLVGSPDSAYLWWQYTNGTTTGSYTVPAPDQPGQYEFRYFLNDGYTLATRSNEVTVTASAYALTAIPVTANPGDNVTASWVAPAGSSATDWVGFFQVGSPNTAYLGWTYTYGAATGNFYFPAPSQSGQYEFRYLPNDGYVDVVRSNPVTVK